jgi:glycine/D-amino acid oxidase-like deaminating enzyme
MEPQIYDVIIIGAGPSGLSTALHLHKYRPSITSSLLVLDKAAFPRDKLCGGGLTSTILALILMSSPTQLQRTSFLDLAILNSRFLTRINTPCGSFGDLTLTFG